MTRVVTGKSNFEQIVVLGGKYMMNRISMLSCLYI